MRPFVLLLAAAAGVASGPAARAETPAARAAAIVDEVCLRAGSPNALLAAGDAAARRYGMTLNGRLSGTQRGVAKAPGSDKPVAVQWRKRVWDFVGRDDANGSLSLQALASGGAGQRFDSCQVALPGDVASEVEGELGRRTSLGTKASLPGNATGWLLAGDMGKPDQGFRLLGISTQQLAPHKPPACSHPPCEPPRPREVTAVGVLDYRTVGAGAR